MAISAKTAGVSHTRIHAAFIQTILVPRTVIVACALSTWNLGKSNVRNVAFDAWITLIAGWTTTLGIMIPCSTLSIHATVFQATGVQAAAMKAHLGASALGIMLASAGHDDSLNGYTIARIVGNSIARTLADHGSERERVQDGTALLWTAHMWSGTRIRTTLINTSQF